MIEKMKLLLNKDKRTSNLVLLVILLSVILISMNYLFGDSEETEDILKQTSSTNVTYDVSNNLEDKLARIISAINGVESAEVMVTYSTTEKVIPVYDVKEDVDTTKDSTKTTTEKTVAYETKDGTKVAIVESKETAVATGAIVVVNGSVGENTKNEIKQAVSAVTEIPLYKIQIFVNN